MGIRNDAVDVSPVASQPQWTPSPAHSGCNEGIDATRLATRGRETRKRVHPHSTAAAILNGLIAPVLMHFTFRIGADESVSLRFTRPRGVSVCGRIATVPMGACAVALCVVAALGG